MKAITYLMKINVPEMVCHGNIVAFIYYVFAKLTETDPMPNSCHFIGLRIECKRRRVAV